jgi:hypothetical protein
MFRSRGIPAAYFEVQNETAGSKKPRCAEENLVGHGFLPGAGLP